MPCDLHLIRDRKKSTRSRSGSSDELLTVLHQSLARTEWILTAQPLFYWVTLSNSLPQKRKMLWCGSKGALESGEKSEKQLRLTDDEGASGEAGKVRGVRKINPFCIKDQLWILNWHFFNHTWFYCEGRVNHWYLCRSSFAFISPNVSCLRMTNAESFPFYDINPTLEFWMNHKV